MLLWKYQVLFLDLEIVMNNPGYENCMAEWKHTLKDFKY